MYTETSEKKAVTTEVQADAKQAFSACCRMCRLPVRWCICSYAPKTALKASLTLLVHSIEWRKTSNTGHLIRSVAPDWRVLVQGKPQQRLSDRDFLWNDKKPYVLFPGRGARKISEIPDKDRADGIHLIVPDGNWRQSSHMLKRLAPLHNMPVVMLSDAAPEHRRMRINISPERMSTFEAVVLALAEFHQFEGNHHAPEQMMHFFRLYADRMLMLRGKLKATETEKPLRKQVY